MGALEPLMSACCVQGALLNALGASSLLTLTLSEVVTINPILYKGY